MSTSPTRLSLDDGSTLELGPTLARAGEGTIYGIAQRTGLAVKLFHPELAGLDEKLAKVAAMVETEPSGAVQDDGFVVLAWPQKLVYREGSAVGFLMPRIDTAQAVEIHSLSNPSARANPLPSAPQWTARASWPYLVTAAANLCLAVDVVHRVDAVIGDFQERNILVADTARVTLVDCDSMQFTDHSGRQYLSPLGRPEFTAPELATVDLRKTARAKTSDLFALAVHIHLLIMAGNHPFLRGVWTGSGEQPNALTLASQGDWAGGPGSQLHTHPLAPPVSFLPNEIQVLFVRAFTDGARDPDARPTAEEWRTALAQIKIVSCRKRPDHQIPAGTHLCPWCEIDRVREARKAATGIAGRAQTAMPSLSGPRQSPSQSPRPASTDAAPSSPSSRGNGGLLLVGTVAMLLAALAILVVGIVVSGEESTTATTASTSSKTPTVRSTVIWTTRSPTVPVQTYTPIETPTVPSTYPPPEAQSFDSVHQNAKIGECINRQLGAQRGDGSLEVTSLYLTDCGAPDATHRITARTYDTDECPEIWVRSDQLGSVLCMTEN
jgi:DNA-binding helix-hairpin-helix protein with protein kinase domain